MTDQELVLKISQTDLVFLVGMLHGSLTTLIDTNHKDLVSNKDNRVIKEWMTRTETLIRYFEKELGWRV